MAEREWKLDETVKPFSGGAETRWIDSGRVSGNGFKETIVLFNSDLATARKVASHEKMYQRLKQPSMRLIPDLTESILKRLNSGSRRH